MPDAGDSVQELLIAARRNQILDAATRVFAEKGFHRATVKDIARAAGIADGTIYTYFPSKTEVLLGILNRLNQSSERAQHFEFAGEMDLRTFFTTYLRQRLALFWPNAEVFQAVLPEMLSNSELRETYYQQVILPTIAVAEGFFESLIAAGVLRPIDGPLTIRSLAGLVGGLLLLQLLGDETIARRWEELPELLTTLLFDGLQTREEPPQK